MPGRRPLAVSALALILAACSGNPSGAPVASDPPTTSRRSTTTDATGSSAEVSTGTDDPATSGPIATDEAGPAAPPTGDTTPVATEGTAAPTTVVDTTSTTTTTTIPATTTTVPGQPPVVEAAAYAVFDTRSGQFLAQSEAATRRPVGSLMKMLTAYVAYAAGNPTRVIPAPDGLLLSSDESNIGIRPGQELARDLLIRGMLKASANDAARMLAIDIAGSEAAFAEQMNAAAATLNLADTHAANATGLDAEGQYSTASDMTRLGVFLMANPSFQIAVRDPTAELNGQAFPNTNDLIGTYPGADGIKTGHTTEAGWCVVASATRENRRIVVAVLGAPTEEARNAAATALLNWGFAQP